MFIFFVSALLILSQRRWQSSHQ